MKVGTIAVKQFIEGFSADDINLEVFGEPEPKKISKYHQSNPGIPVKLENKTHVHVFDSIKEAAAFLDVHPKYIREKEFLNGYKISL